MTEDGSETLGYSHFAPTNIALRAGAFMSAAAIERVDIADVPAEVVESVDTASYLSTEGVRHGDMQSTHNIVSQS